MGKEKYSIDCDSVWTIFFLFGFLSASSSSFFFFSRSGAFCWDVFDFVFMFFHTTDCAGVLVYKVRARSDVSHTNDLRVSTILQRSLCLCTSRVGYKQRVYFSRCVRSSRETGERCVIWNGLKCIFALYVHNLFVRLARHTRGKM